MHVVGKLQRAYLPRGAARLTQFRLMAWVVHVLSESFKWQRFEAC
jgi:hypothetical protein